MLRLRKALFLPRIALIAMLWAVACVNAAAQTSPSPPAKVHQLRIYQIFDDTRAQFHARFRDHAMRIMRRHDFDIVAMWESRGADRLEFVYLLEWPDEATMRDRWAKFMADEEWIRIKRETRAQGPMVGDIQDRPLHVVDYSPRQDFRFPPRP